MADTFAFFNLGAQELLIILLIALLLFGSRKLPQLARSLGASMGELRKGMHEGEHDKNQAKADEKPRQETAS